MKPTIRAALLAVAALIARGAAACPSCAASASPKDPNIWPLVGLFMLVPWILAAVVTILIRRESTSFFGRRKKDSGPLAAVLGFSRPRKPRPA
ncbi:MAG: hypothetical protein ACXVH0_10435 [Thermoanaerobaculia bacterium]